jgi:HSP20 family molecular chaperone IbpA
MAQISISKYTDPEAMPETMLERIGAITDIIRERAYDLFESRDGASGSDLGDWLQAERDTVWLPVSELLDEGTEFRARLALPGFDAKDVQVSALRDALVVQADATHTHEGHNGNVCFCEFSQNKVFRRINLPASIDVDKVSASLDKGILLVTAPKAAKQVAAAAA